jgi:hypothetical protein
MPLDKSPLRLPSPDRFTPPYQAKCQGAAAHASRRRQRDAWGSTGRDPLPRTRDISPITEANAGLGLAGYRMKKPTEPVPLRREEGERLRAPVHQSHVPAAVAGRLAQIIRTFLWLVVALQESPRPVSRLRRGLFAQVLMPAPPLEASSASSPAGGEEPQAGGAAPAAADAGAAAAGAAPPEPAQRQAQGPATGGQRPGTGRLGAAVDAGAERLAGRPEELAAGQRCPVCGPGTFYALPPGGAMRIDGQALVSARRYARHKWRGSACGPMCTAPLPPEAGETHYRPRARAVLAGSRYDLGRPVYRVEGSHALRGGPMPDATQWDQREQGGDCCSVVFASLETVAAPGERIHQDDTSVRILPLLQAQHQRRARAAAQGFARPTARTGRGTTALGSRRGEHPLCLDSSGRAHAGEHLAAWLEQREADRAPPVVMSDALARTEGKAGGGCAATAGRMDVVRAVPSRRLCPAHAGWCSMSSSRAVTRMTRRGSRNGAHRHAGRTTRHSASH